MRIYFGKASEVEVFNWGTDGLMKHEDSYYNNMVEFGSNPGGMEDIIISDSCGRSIPVSVDFVAELCTALSECANIRADIEHAEDMAKNVMDRNSVATVCENGHVHY